MMLHLSRTHSPPSARSAHEIARARIGLIGLGLSVGVLLLLNLAAGLA